MRAEAPSFGSWAVWVELLLPHVTTRNVAIGHMHTIGQGKTCLTSSPRCFRLTSLRNLSLTRRAKTRRRWQVCRFSFLADLSVLLQIWQVTADLARDNSSQFQKATAFESVWILLAGKSRYWEDQECLACSPSCFHLSSLNLSFARRSTFECGNLHTFEMTNLDRVPSGARLQRLFEKTAALIRVFFFSSKGKTIGEKVRTAGIEKVKNVPTFPQAASISVRCVNLSFARRHFDGGNLLSFLADRRPFFFRVCFELFSSSSEAQPSHSQFWTSIALKAAIEKVKTVPLLPQAASQFVVWTCHLQGKICRVSWQIVTSSSNSNRGNQLKIGVWRFVPARYQGFWSCFISFLFVRPGYPLRFVCSHVQKQCVQRHQTLGVEPCVLSCCCYMWQPGTLPWDT